jgi:small subunit ribosomal protein S18
MVPHKSVGSNNEMALERKIKVKVCRFCENREERIDYKDEKRLRRFITERGKIIPRRMSGACAKHQREVMMAIKRARHLALLPFSAEMFK